MRKINFKNNKFFLTIIRDLFIAFFGLFVIFAFLELFKPRIVANYLNLDIFLFLLLLLGAAAIMLQPQPQEKKGCKLKFLDYPAIILFSVLAGVLISHLTREIGILSILIGVASTVICYYFIKMLNSDFYSAEDDG